ncbi:DNA replication initiation protein [Oenococcus oeni]|uniref:DUF2075 domain-containing protein n=1 Tax=Oenococcus oeni TaxID=1247 RepID=UPI0008F92E17|nr:DUF2075 domain-containing protein [Oenococcus oeni]OIL37525.1 DNA replication initiation protein [Oenococcus oeni]
MEQNLISSKGTFLLDKDEKLSLEQKRLIEKIITFSQENISSDKTSILVIEGDAGTGKSLILQQAFTKIQQIAEEDRQSPLYQTKNFLLVNHAEMLKIYRKLAGENPHLKKNSFMKPTSYINQSDKLQRNGDIVLIDEAHLLLTQSDNYNKFHQNNQLLEIIKRSRILILVFDPYQVLKFKSLWSKGKLADLIAAYPHEIFHLQQQYRIEDAGNNLANWINQLTRKRKIVPSVESRHFDLKFFENPRLMFQQIKLHNQQFGLSRMLATTDFPYTVGKGVWYVQAGDFRLPWDQLDVGNEPWALRDETINEVGSIYTIQGFDLNYVGLIIGPSIAYDEKKEKVTVDPRGYEDHAAFRTPQGSSISTEDQQQIMLNALNVLLKRGRKGLYIYACDKKLRHCLEQVRIVND